MGIINGLRELLGPKKTAESVPVTPTSAETEVQRRTRIACERRDEIGQSVGKMQVQVAATQAKEEGRRHRLEEELSKEGGEKKG